LTPPFAHLALLCRNVKTLLAIGDTSREPVFRENFNIYIKEEKMLARKIITILKKQQS